MLYHMFFEKEVNFFSLVLIRDKTHLKRNLKTKRVFWSGFRKENTA